MSIVCEASQPPLPGIFSSFQSYPTPWTRWGETIFPVHRDKGSRGSGGKEEAGLTTDVLYCSDSVLKLLLGLQPVTWAVPFRSSTLPHHRPMQNGKEPLESSVARILKASGFPVEVQTLV